MLAKLNLKTQLRLENYKKYATSLNVKLDQLTPDTSSYVSKLHQEWIQAKPFKSLPGPTKFQKFRGFLKGGEFHGKPFDEFLRMCRKRYGDIYLIPGLFGQQTNLITFNIEDYEKILRTEGHYPQRPGNEIIYDYRVARKDDLYDEGNLGLAGSNGPQWGKFRHAVNPVLMQPKNIVLYIDPTQKVNNDFIKRIRQIRDPTSLEVPENFLSEIYRLSFESVAAVALDKDLGLVRNESPIPEAVELFDNFQVFSKALYELGVKPSIHKIIRTPNYLNFERSMDTITNICLKYVDETLQRIEEKGLNGEDKSILEQLVKIDRKIAIITAVDLLFAGVEATASTLSGALLCLATSPEKQQKLRQEILNTVGKTENFTMENMKNLPYLRACIKEAMRIYPVIFGNMRSTGMDLCLSGYQIPKGTNVYLVSNMLLQEECYFPQPMEFIPERWLRSSKDAATVPDGIGNNIKPFIFMPFGFGPRSCVGKRVVELELEIALANIVRNFQMEFNYSTENAFENNFMNTCVIPLKFKFTDLK